MFGAVIVAWRGVVRCIGMIVFSTAALMIVASESGAVRVHVELAAANPGTPIRLGGDDRVATAIAVSMTAFPSSGTAGAVVVVRDDTFADGVTAAPLAVALHAPILLTAPEALDPRTESEMERVLPTGRTVFVVGGTDALSDAVANRIGADGYQVYRVAGPNRFATAADIATVLGNPPTVLLATGDNFADALVSGPAAARAGGVVLLTDDTRMPPETAAYLAANPPRSRYAIGDQAVAAAPDATPVRGKDRYDTSVAVAEQFWSGAGGTAVSDVGVATGLNFPDALAGGAQIPPGGPLLLTTPDQLPSTVNTYIQRISCSVTLPSYIYGQSDVVTDNVENQMADDLSGNFCP